MFKKYGIYCENCNVLLNNEDDILGSNLGKLYHSTCMQLNHGKSADCQQLMLFRMNLKFADTPTLTTEAEEQNIEHNNSNNGLLQYVQELKAKIKTLEDALLQAKSDANKLTDCVQTAENNNTVDKALDGGNNITQDSNANKQTHNENNLSSCEQHNVVSASEEHHTCTIVSEDKQEVLDLRRNCVLIENPDFFSISLDRNFSSVRKLANEMNARIADNSLIHMDIDTHYPNLFVYFRDGDSKKEFLKNRFIYQYNPHTAHKLRILDYSDYGIVDIKNFRSSDLSLETAFVNVLGLAEKMGMPDIRNFIDYIDVYSAEPNVLTYSVRFNRCDMQNAFLRNKDILKQFPETKFLEISAAGGHTLSSDNVNNFSMIAASANVVGVAKLMGLSLSTDNIKRIYVLNIIRSYLYQRNLNFSLVVEFFNNDIKNKFLEKQSEFKRNVNTRSSDIHISDIKTEGNSVLITYYNDSNNIFTAISFIGLAKQLGFSFTPDQIDCFYELSKFISRASS